MVSGFHQPCFRRRPPVEDSQNQDQKSNVSSFAASSNSLVPRAISARSFEPTEVASIYNNQPVVPGPSPPRVTFISFGGALGIATYTSDLQVTAGDIITHWRQQGINPLPSLKVMLVDGAHLDPSDPDSSTENIMDADTIGSFCPGAQITMALAPNTSDSMLTVLTAVFNMNPKPNVVSISWGFPESYAPPAFLQQCNAVLKQFADAGITVCVATGDTGAQDSTSTLTTDFPACSPYVCACGGTKLLSSTNTYSNTTTVETVWNEGWGNGATGGGVSKVFSKPAYQNVVSGTTMRSIPDVSGVADPVTGVQFIQDNTRIVVGGTSFVAPMFAGAFAAMRCTQFANVPLYKNMSVFHDITSGNNAQGRSGGYNATSGYDMCGNDEI